MSIIKRINLFVFFTLCAISIFCQPKDQVIKKEKIGNDTVIWVKHGKGKTISAYIMNDKLELKNCPKLKDLQKPENTWYVTNKFLSSENVLKQKDSLVSVFLNSITQRQISELLKVEKNPVVIAITIDSIGGIISTSIMIKSDGTKVFTSNDVYNISNSIRTKITFDKPSDYDLGCVTFSLPVSKERISSMNTVN